MVITSPEQYNVLDGEVLIGTLVSDEWDSITWSISGDEIQIVDSVMSFVATTDKTVKDQYTETVTLTKDDTVVNHNITINIV
jgi:hypothetical protein